VLDITTTELADELVAHPDRRSGPFDRAARRGVPQVVSVGATDMVNFGPPDTVPERFRIARFYQHNPTVTLMRTTVEENARLARDRRKVAASRGPRQSSSERGVRRSTGRGSVRRSRSPGERCWTPFAANCGRIELLDLDLTSRRAVAEARRTN